MLERLPLTRGGATLGVFALIAYAAGWRFGWIELMVLTAACLLALLIAVPFVVGRLRLDVQRELDPQRVTVGEPAVAILTVTNPSKAPVGWRSIEDRVASPGETVTIEISGLAAGETREAMHRLPTSQRGVISVGPAIVAKADPLGLMRREVRQAEPDTLWVHPRVVAVNPVPVGFAKDLEGPTSDTSPAGDVAFHTLREYQVGDDHRHVHWLSSARAGSLMVRHYVDNRRPHLTVVLDDRAESYRGESFELAVEVAGSITVNSQLQQQPIALRFGSNPIIGQAVGASADDVLDQLTLVQPEGGLDQSLLNQSLLNKCQMALQGERGTSAIVIVTGSLEADELLAVVGQIGRTANVLIARCWPEGQVEATALPGAEAFDIDSLDRFQIAWNRVMQ